MRKQTLSIVLGLMALGTAAMFLAGCPVTVHTTTEPTTAPPAAPVVSVTCGPNQYLRGGKHVWRHGRWRWVAPRCVARAGVWRAGCRWVRGHWVRQGRHYRFRAGRLVCPRRRIVRVGPTAMPPAPPAVAITCGPNQYLRGGKHVWRGGKWVWVAPRCIARPTTWRAGCRWTRGGWKRVGGRLRYLPGRLFCPKVVPLAVVHPTWLPPARPPKTYRRVRCRRGTRYYPGRYVWNNLARRYVWRGGKCIPRRRGCRWVAGRWTVHNGRSYYIRPAWRCRGKLSYVGIGGAWTPPPAYTGFIRRKACRRGYFRNAKNRCVRFKRRCPAGFMLRRGRCFKRFVPKRCGRGWVLRAGRCVRVGGAVRPCPVGFRRVGARCVKMGKVKRCRPGFILRGRRCVRAPRAVKRCRPGFALRGRRCVKVRQPVKRCRPGFALRGRRCVKVRRPVKRCRPGFVLRAGRCVKVRRVKRCGAGFVLRAGRCVRVRKPMRVRRPMRVRKPMRAKRCRRGFVLRRGRCVKR